MSNRMHLVEVQVKERFKHTQKPVTQQQSSQDSIVAPHHYVPAPEDFQETEEELEFQAD